MEHRWHSPAETWPLHPATWWNEALGQARAAGWHLVTFSGHSWGKVVCSREVEEPHQKLILSTGRGSENHARDLSKLIARCHHARDDQQPVDYSNARRLLRGVELLLAAAKKCVAAEEKRALAKELLERCEEALGEVDDLLDQAVKADDERQGDIVDAYTFAAQAGYPRDAPHTVEALVGDAEARLETASVEVDQTPASSERTELLSRAAALREHIAVVRGQADGHSELE